MTLHTKRPWWWRRRVVNGRGRHSDWMDGALLVKWPHESEVKQKLIGWRANQRYRHDYFWLIGCEKHMIPDTLAGWYWWIAYHVKVHVILYLSYLRIICCSQRIAFSNCLYTYKKYADMLIDIHWTIWNHSKTSKASENNTLIIIAYVYAISTRQDYPQWQWRTHHEKAQKNAKHIFRMLHKSKIQYNPRLL